MSGWTIIAFVLSCLAIGMNLATRIVTYRRNKRMEWLLSLSDKEREDKLLKLFNHIKKR